MNNDQQIINLMEQLRQIGCRISADGDKLRIRKTKNDIPAELIQQIKINKTEILAFLNTAKDQAVTSQKDIPKLPRNASKQLSLAQQKLWFLGQLETYDVVICGGGLAGLTLARQLKLQKPDLSIVVLDKMTSPLPEAKFKVGESTVEVGAFYLANTLQLTDYFEEQHLVKLGLRYFFNNHATKF